MKRQDRAKQIMPFAALKGYEEALRQREDKPQQRIILGEDEAEELDRKLRSLTVGSRVKIRHYRKRCYVVSEGTVNGIMYTVGQLKVEKEDIRYGDIVELEIL